MSAAEALRKARALILEDCAALVACHTHPVSGKMDDEAAVAARARYHEALAMIDAALDAGQAQPEKWENAEGWESLAWELCADEHGEDACGELLWEGGAIPEPWGERWLKYEGEAKRLIALVRKHAPLYTAPQASQPVAPAGWKPVPVEATLDMLSATMRECGGIGAGSCGEHAGIDYDDLRSVWAEMLSAAPPAPAAQPLTDERIDKLCEAACLSAASAGDLDLQPKHFARNVIAEFCRINGIGAQP